MSRLYVKRAEMCLTYPDVEPLRRPPLEPNPVDTFQKILDRVDTAKGERGDVVVDLMPLRPPERVAFRNRQRKAEISNYVKANKPAKTNWLQLLWKDPSEVGAPTIPYGMLERNEAAEHLGRADAEEVARRIAGPTPLFRLQVLMRVACITPERAEDLSSALVAAWEQWSGRNEMMMSKIDLKYGYIGSNMPGRSWWFDYRLRTGRFNPWRKRHGRVVSIYELASWIIPPKPLCAPDATPPVRATEPEAPTAPDTRGRPPADTAPLMNDDTDVLPPTDTPRSDGTMLLYGIGRRGTAPDRIAAKFVAKAANAGAGVVVLEADGRDRWAGVPMWGKAHTIEAPLLTADILRPVPGWNPVLPPKPRAPVDRTAVAVRALTAAAGGAAQTAALVDAAVHTLQAVVGFLPAELAPTLLQLGRLVVDERWRQALLPVLDASRARFWTDVLPGLDSDIIDGVVELADRLRDDAAAIALLGQAETTYDPSALLAEGTTVALSGDAAPLDPVLASLLWFDASGAARALAESGAQPAPVLVATATHRYSRDSAGLFADDLSATVMSGTRTVVLTDRPDRHSGRVRRAIRELATGFAVDEVDVGMDVAARWLGLGGEEELRARLNALDMDECLAASSREGWQPRPFHAVGVASARALGSARPVRAGRAFHDIQARLDGLEERIVEHLARPTPPPEPGGRGPGSGQPSDAESNVVSFDPTRRRRQPESSLK